MEKQQLADYIHKETNLTEEQMELVLQFFKPSTFAKNEAIFNEGQINQYMSFIVQGCARIYFIKEDGQEVTRYVAFENEFITGLASFISQKPALENMQALETTHLLRISRKDCYYLLNLIPGWETFYRRYLEHAYINNLNIYQREVTKDARLRYQELLEHHPKMVQRLSNKILASCLNMKPETLSRLKGRK